MDPNTAKTLADSIERILAYGAIGVGLLVLIVSAIILFLITRRSREENQLLTKMVDHLGTPLQRMADAIPALIDVNKEQTAVVQEHVRLTRGNRDLLEALANNQAETTAGVMELRASVDSLTAAVEGVKTSTQELGAKVENGERKDALDAIKNQVTEAVKQINDLQKKIEALHAADTAAKPDLETPPVNPEPVKIEPPAQAGENVPGEAVNA